MIQVMVIGINPFTLKAKFEENYTFLRFCGFFFFYWNQKKKKPQSV